MGLRRFREVVDVFPRQGATAAHRDTSHTRAVGGALEEGHRERLDLRGPVGDRKVEAQIGFVGAVALQRVAPRETRERALDLVADFVPQRDEDPLDDGEHVLLPDERRFDVDLRELRLAIVPQILVAETPRDLEITIEPRHHQELLVDLRRLR